MFLGTPQALICGKKENTSFREFPLFNLRPTNAGITKQPEWSLYETQKGKHRGYNHCSNALTYITHTRLHIGFADDVSHGMRQVPRPLGSADGL